MTCTLAINHNPSRNCRTRTRNLHTQCICGNHRVAHDTRAGRHKCAFGVSTLSHQHKKGDYDALAVAIVVPVAATAAPTAVAVKTLTALNTPVHAPHAHDATAHSAPGVARQVRGSDALAFVAALTLATIAVRAAVAA